MFEDEFKPQEIALIRSLFKEIIIIEPLKDQEKSIEKNKANLELLKRPELSHTLLKARLWELVQSDQVLFLDADTLPLNKDFLKSYDYTLNKQDSRLLRFQTSDGLTCSTPVYYY